MSAPTGIRLNRKAWFVEHVMTRAAKLGMTVHEEKTGRIGADSFSFTAILPDTRLISGPKRETRADALTGLAVLLWQQLSRFEGDAQSVAKTDPQQTQILRPAK